MTTTGESNAFQPIKDAGNHGKTESAVAKQVLDPTEARKIHTEIKNAETVDPKTLAALGDLKLGSFKEDFNHSQDVAKDLLDKLNKPGLSAEEVKKLFPENPDVKFDYKDNKNIDHKTLEQIMDKLKTWHIPPEEWKPNPFDPKMTHDKDGRVTEVDHGFGKGKETIEYGKDGKPSHIHMADGQDWTKNPDGTWNVHYPGKPPDFKEHTDKNQKMDVRVDQKTGDISWDIHKADGTDVIGRKVTADGKYEEGYNVKPLDKAEHEKGDKDNAAASKDAGESRDLTPEQQKKAAKLESMLHGDGTGAGAAEYRQVLAGMSPEDVKRVIAQVRKDMGFGCQLGQDNSGKVYFGGVTGPLGNVGGYPVYP